MSGSRVCERTGGIMYARITTLVGATLLVVGALLPWATMTAPLVGIVNLYGYQGDGRITGGIGLLLFLGALITRATPGKRYSVAIGLLAALALLVAGLKVLSVGFAEAVVSGLATGSIGMGVWVSVLGATLAVVGGLTKVPEVAAQAGPGPTPTTPGKCR
jgi:hypothetical protein